MLVKQVREAGLNVDLRFEGERRPLPAGVDLSAFPDRAGGADEHAQARRPGTCARDGALRPEAIEVEVVDDGTPAGRAGRGHGLLGMRERAAVVGGRVETGPRSGRGYAVRASLPT